MPVDVLLDQFAAKSTQLNVDRVSRTTCTHIHTHTHTHTANLLICTCFADTIIISYAQEDENTVSKIEGELEENMPVLTRIYKYKVDETGGGM